MQFADSTILDQKNKLVSIDPLQPDDDGTPRHQIGTTIWKCFNSVECKGEIAQYDHNNQLHQILHSDVDQE